MWADADGGFRGLRNQGQGSHASGRSQTKHTKHQAWLVHLPMSKVLAACPKCGRLVRIPPDRLGTELRCICNEIHRASLWSCNECRQILRDDTLTRCPRCHAGLNPATYSLLKYVDASNASKKNPPEPSNTDVSVDLPSEQVVSGDARTNQQTDDGPADEEPPPQPGRGVIKQGVDSHTTTPFGSRGISELPSNELQAYEREQQLIGERRAGHEISRLRQKVQVLEQQAEEYKRLLVIQNGSVMEVIRCVVFKTYSTKPLDSNVIVPPARRTPRFQLRKSGTVRRIDMTIEQQILFPVTRSIILAATALILIPMGFFIFSYITSQPTTSTTDITVSLESVLPDEGLTKRPSSNEKPDALPTSLATAYPDAGTDQLLPIFTATGLFDNQAVEATILKELGRIHVNDTPRAFVENACSILKRVPASQIEFSFYRFVQQRRELFEAAVISRRLEEERIREDRAELRTFIGFTAFGLLQAVLILCILGIERNTRLS